MRCWICGVSGVLIDSTPLIRAAFVATGVRFHIPRVAERLRSVTGCTLPAAYRVLDRDVDPIACAAFHVAYVRERLGHVRSQVGVFDTLRDARRSGIGIMAAANNGELAEAFLVHTGLYPFIDYLVTQEDSNLCGRHPHILFRGLDLLRAGRDSSAAAAVLYVTDVPADIVTGNAAEIVTVGTTYGEAAEVEIQAAQPKHVICAFDAMRRFLPSSCALPSMSAGAPATPQAQTIQQYVEGVTPIEPGSVGELTRTAACGLAASRLRGINARTDAVVSAADDQQRGARVPAERRSRAHRA